MENKFFLTIGYGRSKFNNFLRALKAYKINCVVDVRSSPKSRYDSDFDKQILSEKLAKEKIEYQWLGYRIGGRSDDCSLFEGNVISYEKLVKSKKFVLGLYDLEELIKSRNVVVMCSESEPMDCHRFMAISRELSVKGYKIWHILKDGSYKTNEELEKELVSKYYHGQMNLFSNEIEESYRKHNLAKGFSKKY